jgi:hypothetical protein
MITRAGNLLSRQARRLNHRTVPAPRRGRRDRREDKIVPLPHPESVAVKSEWR